MSAAQGDIHSLSAGAVYCLLLIHLIIMLCLIACNPSLCIQAILGAPGSLDEDVAMDGACNDDDDDGDTDAAVLKISATAADVSAATAALTGTLLPLLQALIVSCTD